MQLAMDVQDSLDIARVTTEEELLSLRCAAAEVQKNMRRIQGDYVKQHDKPTVAERLYKIDPAHAQLEMLLSKLQAHIAYAEGLLKAVDDKSFKLGTLMKGLV
ncbi:MAG: hypothetical protein MZW92_31330 [Comamonadaceae bacterium]|nr:hypothetical protein [Comamonadaceae bacterium]